MDRTTRRSVLSNLLLNVVAPIAVFYGLRALGASAWWALTLGAVPPAIAAVAGLVRRRRIDGIGAFTVAVLLLSVAVSFLTGSPRFLLAKDGWLTAAGGLGVLATLLRTPFYYAAVRTITTGAMRERAEAAWRDSPGFRHTMRVATAIWGVGLTLDAVVRVVLAYTLPVDRVPLVSGVQYVVVFVGLEVGSQLYVRRNGKELRPEVAQ